MSGVAAGAGAGAGTGPGSLKPPRVYFIEHKGKRIVDHNWANLLNMEEAVAAVAESAPRPRVGGSGGRGRGSGVGGRGSGDREVTS